MGIDPTLAATRQERRIDGNLATFLGVVRMNREIKE